MRKMTGKVMRILMMSNTYTPVIGGIEASIQSFTKQLRKQGHEVMIVAPTFEGMDKNEQGVIRIPAIQNFLKEDVSLTLPVPIFLSHFMKEFQPDVIHSHQFFWVGDMALRLARQYHIPLVYTHHIMLNEYADFLPLHNEGVKRFVIKLATGYANLSDCVIAPSQSILDVLREAGVTQSIQVIPTGVDVNRFKNGDGLAVRRKYNIPEDAFVIGCVCRLVPEKNLEFLAKAAGLFLKKNHGAHCLIVGEGSSKDAIKNIFDENGVQGRLHCTGALEDMELVNAYHAMDVFIFSSHSETQGIVLIEAMASGTPVAALDAPAIWELIKDRKNGRLISLEDENDFVKAVSWFTQLNKKDWKKIKQNASTTAEEFSIERSTDRLLDIYKNLKLKNKSAQENGPWDSFKDCLKVEKDLLKNAIEATEAAFKRD